MSDRINYTLEQAKILILNPLEKAAKLLDITKHAAYYRKERYRTHHYDIFTKVMRIFFKRAYPNEQAILKAFIPRIKSKVKELIDTYILEYMINAYICELCKQIKDEDLLSNDDFINHVEEQSMERLEKLVKSFNVYYPTVATPTFVNQKDIGPMDENTGEVNSNGIRNVLCNSSGLYTAYDIANKFTHFNSAAEIIKLANDNQKELEDYIKITYVFNEKGVNKLNEIYEKIKINHKKS